MYLTEECDFYCLVRTKLILFLQLRKKTLELRMIY